MVEISKICGEISFNDKIKENFFKEIHTREDHLLNY